MKVIFAAAECYPFAKTGGLGDVAGSLPKELVKNGAEVRVFLPLYSSIPDSYTDQMRFIQEFTVSLAWRQLSCSLFELEHNGVIYNFIGNDHYFDRASYYGQDDDAECFAFFSKAILEALPNIGFQPDVLHCNDWQTAMVVVFFKAFYQHLDFYLNTKSVFTIHNLLYQGIFPQCVLGDVLGLGMEFFHKDALEFYGDVNFMKGAIAYADIITTVSKTYAQEIQTPYFGAMLYGLINWQKDHLFGIINGIDCEKYNPATDNKIFEPYTKSLVKKRQNKVELQESLHLPVDEDIPMIGIISRLVEQKGFDLIERVMEEILNLDIQLVILGTGEKQYEDYYKKLAKMHPEKISANIFFDDTFSHKLYAASDIFLMPSLFEPCGTGQLIAMRYGAIPVVRETGGLKDTIQPFNKFTNDGNGFSFSNFDAFDMLHVLESAIELYKDKPIWEKITRNAMQTDVSWRKSAKEYLEIYQK